MLRTPLPVLTDRAIRFPVAEWLPQLRLAYLRLGSHLALSLFYEPIDTWEYRSSDFLLIYFSRTIVKRLPKCSSRESRDVSLFISTTGEHKEWIG